MAPDRYDVIVIGARCAGSPTAMLLARQGHRVLLVDAAAESGVEVREAFTVDEIEFDDGRVAGIRGHAPGGGPVVEHGDLVVGADGRFSLLAKAVGPEQCHERSPILCGYYSYWSGLPAEGSFAVTARPERGWAVAPTHDDLTLVVAGWPYRDRDTYKHDVEGTYLGMFDLAPEFAERIRGATRESRIAGTGVENYFRKPFGPGWALVGDAGYNKDFITAQGITDAFRDAEHCADALHRALSGTQPFDEVMAEYQATRDAHVLPMFEFTCQLATLEPPPPEMQQLLAAMHGNQDAMDGFARVNGGVTSPAEFFSEESIGRILGAAG
jgi:flavin-dependent dehydrogenase